MNRLMLMLSLALGALLSACAGESTEKGVVPRGAPVGEVIALEADSAGTRLLKAYRHALYESYDGARSWKPVPLPSSAQEGSIAAVAIPEKAPGVLYVAGPGLGVMRSEDGGRTWSALNEGLPSREVEAFATHADQTGTLYAYLPEKGIYRSEDTGETWTRMDGGPGAPIRQLFHSNMAGSMQTGWLFAVTPEGVRRSMDCFCGWRPTGELPAGEVSSIAYDPRKPELVYAATSAGLFRTTNGGERWERVSAGPQVSALAITPAVGALYGATPDGSLVLSLDQGLKWERVGA